MIPAVLAALASKGLGLLSDAIIAKGKDAVEKKLGVKIPATEEALTPEAVAKLWEAQAAHETFLLECLKVEAGAQAEATKAVTDRWQADMASDSKLSKAVRPGTLIYLLVLFTGFAIAALFGYSLPDAYLKLLGELLWAVFVAYFVGRSGEKGVSMIAAILPTKKG